MNQEDFANQPSYIPNEADFYNQQKEFQIYAEKQGYEFDKEHGFGTYPENYKVGVDGNTEDDVDEFDDDEEMDEYLYASDETKRMKIKELCIRYRIDHSKLLRKIDFHVVLPFMLVYFCGFLTRSNLGILQIEGIYTSIGLDQLKFYTCYAIFFTPYIAFQFMSNVILRRVRPHFWMSISIMLYGAITLASGYVKNYLQLLVCNFFHGLFQAGVETALFYILAHYYEKRESLKRYSAIYSISCVGGIVGTSIAFSIDKHLAGHKGLESWRWLLIIEGAISMFSSLILFFTIPDFPENARFIDDDETTFLLKKLEMYQGKSGFDLNVTPSEFLHMALDPVVFLPAFAALGIAYVTYCWAFFESVFMLLIGGGTTADINRRSVFPWLVAFVYSNLTSYISDVLQIRFPFVVFNFCVTIIGGALAFAGTVKTVPNHPKYAGCFLACMGAYTATPILICWASTNFGGHSRKNLGITMIVSFGSIGGLVCIFPFYGMDTRYVKGFSTGFGFVLFGLAFTIAYFFVLRRNNRIKKTPEYRQQFSQLSERKQIILGDMNPAFEYMY